MDKFHLPDGYFPKKLKVGEKEFRCLYNKEKKLVLALPIEHCPPQRIEEVAQQIERAAEYVQSHH